MATRRIELFNRAWDCPECGNVSTNGVSKCRKCGREKPVYGIIDSKPDKTPKSKKRTEEGEVFAVSTLLTKDGKTAEDIKKERQ